MSIADSNIDACIHGRIPGNCIRCLQIKTHKQDAEIAALRAEVERLMEMNQALTDCLNGSSKAVYTAEMYDDLRSRVEQDEKELAECRGKVEKAKEWLAGSIINYCPECSLEIDIIDWDALEQILEDK